MRNDGREESSLSEGTLGGVIFGNELSRKYCELDLKSYGLNCFKVKGVST